MAQELDESTTATFKLETDTEIERNRRTFSEKLACLEDDMNKFAAQVAIADRIPINETLDDATSSSSTRGVLTVALSNLSLANKYMTRFQQLFNQLRDQYSCHLEDVRRSYTQADAELLMWWSKCRVSDQHRTCFGRVKCVEEFDEVAFARYAAEARRCAAHFAGRAALYDAVQLFERAIDEKAAANVTATSDPDRLNNRGGILLKEEIRRRRLQKTIAVRRESLREMISSWEHSNHDLPPFEIDGQPLLNRLLEYEHEYLTKKIAELQRTLAMNSIAPNNCSHCSRGVNPRAQGDMALGVGRASISYDSRRKSRSLSRHFYTGARPSISGTKNIHNTLMTNQPADQCGVRSQCKMCTGSTTCEKTDTRFIIEMQSSQYCCHQMKN